MDNHGLLSFRHARWQMKEKLRNTKQSLEAPPKATSHNATRIFPSLHELISLIIFILFWCCCVVFAPLPTAEDLSTKKTYICSKFKSSYFSAAVSCLLLYLLQEDQSTKKTYIYSKFKSSFLSSFGPFPL